MQRNVMAATALSVMSIGTAFAQAPPQDGRAAQAMRQLRESRYQIGQMERVLEGAVEHGATVIRDRLQGLMPADMLLTENARARGFRLEGYGIFFDVEVPALEGTLPWSFRTMDQNALGLASALQTVRGFVDGAGSNNVDVQQALKRIELQVAPVTASSTAAAPVLVANGAAARPVTATAAPDPILTDPNEEYRTQVRDALIDAMFEHSRGLNVGASETLTVAARRSDDRPRLAPVDTDARTVVISLRGADLAAFLAGQITREEARQRVEVRVF